MTVNLIKYIATFALLCSIANCLMNKLEFASLIKDRCFNKTANGRYLVNGQRIPLSNSMETFIGLIESFEQNYTMYSQAQVAEKFLRRFRIDGQKRDQDSHSNTYIFTPDPIEEARNDLMETIIFGSRPSNKNNQFPEEAFTEEEKCALYFMMSHTFINYTSQDDMSISSPDPMKNGNEGTVEQGVVNLHNHKIHAITPGRLLLGILAGMKRVNKVTLGTILERYSINLDSISVDKRQYVNEEIDPVFAVTVGDVVTEEMARIENDKYSRKFGPNGIWNSTLCATRYFIDAKSKITKATYAELRGAGDGLLLGLMARELQEEGLKITISNLLRMYYSKHALGIQGLTQKYTYCGRYQHWSALDPQIVPEIRNYARLSNLIRFGAGHTETNLNDEVNKAMQAFETSRDEIIDNVIDNARCGEYDTTPCETINDVFVVMDSRGNDPEVYKTQKRIVSDLASYLDIRLFGGSMTVMSSNQGYGDRKLEELVYNTTSKGCINCLVDWVTPQGSTADETFVLQQINRTLMHYEYKTALLPGVPGKALIYFNYEQGPVRDDKNFKDAIWNVHKKHRDVPVFAIGGNTNVLKWFATDDKKILLSEEVDSLGSNLKDMICESFSTFQYPYCKDKKSSLDDFAAYEGYVTPMYTQYWAMYPEYFLKSFNIKFIFNAEGGHIKVCRSRDKRKESLNKDCAETRGSKEERKVEFHVRDPCKGKDVYSCNPIYFSVQGVEIDPNVRCTDKRCKYLDQIKFTVRHEGVACSGASSLVYSLSVLIGIILFCVVTKNV